MRSRMKRRRRKGRRRRRRRKMMRRRRKRRRRKMRRRRMKRRRRKGRRRRRRRRRKRKRRTAPWSSIHNSSARHAVPYSSCTPKPMPCSLQPNTEAYPQPDESNSRHRYCFFKLYKEKRQLPVPPAETCSHSAQSPQNVFTCRFFYTLTINVSDRLTFIKGRCVFLEVVNKYSKMLTEMSFVHDKGDYFCLFCSVEDYHRFGGTWHSHSWITPTTNAGS